MKTTILSKVAIFKETFLSLDVDDRTSLAKLWRKAAHKAFGVKLHDSVLSTVSKFGKEGLITFMNELQVADTECEINEVYSKVGKSCMLDKPVGRFYEKAKLVVLWTSRSRGVVCPKSFQFTSSYGEDWMILQAVLLSCGFNKDDSHLLALNLEEIKYSEADLTIDDIEQNLGKSAPLWLPQVYKESLLDYLSPDLTESIDPNSIIQTLDAFNAFSGLLHYGSIELVCLLNLRESKQVFVPYLDFL